MISDLRNHKAQSIINLIGLFLGIMGIVIVALVSNFVYLGIMTKAEQKTGFKITLHCAISSNIVSLDGHKKILEVLDKDIIERGGQYSMARETTTQVHRQSNDYESVSTVIYAGNIDRVRRFPLTHFG
jgi:hypothetical protein